MITPLPNGHTFAGSAREYDAAEVVHCQRCGAVVKNRHGAIASDLCPKRAFAEPPPLVSPEDTLVDRADALHTLLEQARAKGIRDERARVTRIRNKAFAGKAVDDDMLRLIVDFDRLLASGEDDAT